MGKGSLGHNIFSRSGSESLVCLFPPGMPGCAAVVDLKALANALEEEVLQECLLPGERARLARFALRKRQLEWLGGRLAVKKALIDADRIRNNQSEWRDWTIANAAGGRPYAVRKTTLLREAPAISISHSGRYACGIAGLTQCGVDLQEIRSMITTVRQRFVSHDEQALLASAENRYEGSEQEWLTLLWSVKEAVRKCADQHPLPGFLAMRATRVSRKEADVTNSVFTFEVSTTGRRPATVAARVLPLTGYAAAICCLPKTGDESEDS